MEADLGIGRRRPRDAPQVSRGLGTSIALTNGLERSPLAQERSINEESQERSGGKSTRLIGRHRPCFKRRYRAKPGFRL